VHRLDAVQHEAHGHLLDLHPVGTAGKLTTMVVARIVLQAAGSWCGSPVVPESPEIIAEPLAMAEPTRFGNLSVRWVHPAVAHPVAATWFRVSKEPVVRNRGRPRRSGAKKWKAGLGCDAGSQRQH
jgi:hypothetical protein